MGDPGHSGLTQGKGKPSKSRTNPIRAGPLLAHGMFPDSEPLPISWDFSGLVWANRPVLKTLFFQLGYLHGHGLACTSLSVSPGPFDIGIVAIDTGNINLM